VYSQSCSVRRSGSVDNEPRCVPAGVEENANEAADTKDLGQGPVDARGRLKIFP
jgi:hypothetical protein